MFKTLAALGLLAATAASAQGTSSSGVEYPLDLASGNQAFSTVVLTNTHSRSYTDSSRPPSLPPAPPTPNRCDLDGKVPGVIWKIVLRGASVSAEAISVSDESGRAFVQVCWSSQGGVYQIDAQGNRIGGGAQTEFLAAGPEAPRELLFKFGTSSASITLRR